MNNVRTRSLCGVVIAAAALVPLAACAADAKPPVSSTKAAPATPAPPPAPTGTRSSGTISSAAPTGTTPAATAPGATPPVVGAGNVSPPPPAEAGWPATQLPRPDPTDQACTPAVLLAHVRAAPDGPPAGFKDVKIYNCAHGYARIYAAPNPVAGQAAEGDQFFLQRAGSGWKTLARGLGTDCGDNRPELVAACASFG